MFRELCREMNKSDWTVVVVTEEFSANGWVQYCRDTSFKKLIDDRKEDSLIPIALGIRTLPEELGAKEGLYFDADPKTWSERKVEKLIKVLDAGLPVNRVESNDPRQASAGPMPSAPISDNDRFMCIAYLLNNVGSEVLRQLFIDMVTPTCTLDQYLAYNRSKINSLLKNKVLNVSQMDIMFPPNGDPTNLTDYDITLLSALFNNIVPSLRHQEKNLIKSLRDKRNKLVGHTISCKMNAGDFQTCWSDISSTLITFSQQCGDTKFKNEISLKIQQTQVPDASYLSMIHTLYSRIEKIEQRQESNNTSTSET